MTSSMITIHEKNELQNKRKQQVNSILGSSSWSAIIVELIVHPGDNTVSQSTVGLISLAAIGFAFATIVQILSNS